MTNLETYRPAAPAASQATTIEQSRAVAEVQAAVIVAQQCPRDMNRAEAETRDVCRRMSMAERAFYRVPNRGNGPTVHLMRELARIWGNISYGVMELSRDDTKGESEVQAFAYDLQTNTRSTRSFIVPHERMKGGARQRLTDLGDVYLNNQNTGARAVRECISTVLPTWLTELAQELCRFTLEEGEGEPLSGRIEKMVRAFKSIGVTVAQMEAKIGAKRGQWTAGDVAQMGITYTSITRDGLDKDAEFPPPAVDLTAPKPAANTGAAKKIAKASAESKQNRQMFALFGKIKVTDRGERLTIMSHVLGRDVASSKELSLDDEVKVIDTLQSWVDEGRGDEMVREVLNAATLAEETPAPQDVPFAGMDEFAQGGDQQ